MAARRDWEWVPAPGWPTAPSGWEPPPGWEPDPTWPPAPADHTWWQRTPAAARRRRRRITILGITTLLLVGGCTALVTLGGPCAFDPPPGSFSDVQVTNDTANDLTLGLCDNDRCSRVDRPVRVSAGGHATFNIESCSGGPVAVTTPKGRQLLGCIQISEPVNDDFGNLPPARVSQRRPCGRNAPSFVTYNYN